MYQLVLSITLRFYTKDLHEDKHLLNKELQIINRFVMTTLLDICLTRNFLSVQIYLCHDLSFALIFPPFFYKKFEKIELVFKFTAPYTKFFSHTFKLFTSSKEKEEFDDRIKQPQKNLDVLCKRGKLSTDQKDR